MAELEAKVEQLQEAVKAAPKKKRSGTEQRRRAKVKREEAAQAVAVAEVVQDGLSVFVFDCIVSRKAWLGTEARNKRTVLLRG